MLYYLIFFFFSSRRRHTRYWRDWSSDVCSSDLTSTVSPNGWTTTQAYDANNQLTQVITPDGGTVNLTYDADGRKLRSEERRVGKECRSERAADRLKQKKE